MTDSLNDGLDKDNESMDGGGLLLIKDMVIINKLSHILN